jgi:monothiol glutaredoxin
MRAKITEIIQSDDVVLFMKGSRRFPQCGFSATIVQILDGLVPSYTTVNVLADPEIRDGIKAFSSWPTIPQLYVRGEFIGGCDIVRELHASGDLAKTLGGSGAAAAGPAPLPAVRVSEAAAAALAGATEAEGEHVHVEVSPTFEYGLFVGPRNPGDVEVKAGGVALLFDPASARRADGLSIDFLEGPGGGGFKLESPHEPPRVRQLSPAELKAMQDRGEAHALFDVRTVKEREIAAIRGARMLDEEGRRYLEGLDRQTMIVFHCHHGGRSQAAAERCVAEGFKQVYNLAGGIDAWSVTIDPSVPRY